jgi:hypothetical protein
VGKRHASVEHGIISIGNWSILSITIGFVFTSTLLLRVLKWPISEYIISEHQNPISDVKLQIMCFESMPSKFISGLFNDALCNSTG